MKDFLIKSRIYNNQLIQRRKELELSARQMAERIGISYSLYLQFESMKQSPYRLNGELRTQTKKICEFHGLGVDVLFPEGINEVTVHTIEHQFDAEELNCLELMTGQKYLPSPEDFLSAKELVAQTKKVLDTLSPQEEKVLRMRFGIDDDQKHTFQALGSDFNLSRQRIKSIEKTALNKLRHPSRSRLLKPLLN